MNDEKAYWDYRAEHRFYYKNEALYTITPAPLYFYRRRCLLNLLMPEVEPQHVKRICDFGCGDGWYLRYLSDRLPDKEWSGVDISQGMLDEAFSRDPNARYVLIDGKSKVEFEEPFDLIYSIAVFAHILDDYQVVNLFQDLAHSLGAGGAGYL